MKIQPSSNQDKLKAQYGISNVSRGDVTLLNIFELMVVLQKICKDIQQKPESANLQATFSEFCGICFLLQTISNNFAGLKEEYKQCEKFKEIAEIIGLSRESYVADRLSIAHIIDIVKLYTINCNIEHDILSSVKGSKYIVGNMLEYVDQNLFNNHLFKAVTKYCSNLLEQFGGRLESPKIIGQIEPLIGIERYITHNDQLNLPFNDLTAKYDSDDLHRALAFNFLFIEDLYQNNNLLFSNQTFESEAIQALVFQACANGLKVIRHYTKDDNEWHFIVDELDDMVRFRNSIIAHSINLNSLKKCYEIDWYDNFKAFVTKHNSKTYNSIKDSMQFTQRESAHISSSEKQEEPEISSNMQQETAVSVKSKNPVTPILSFEELLKEFSKLVSDYDGPQLSSFDISYRLMEILIDYYNHPNKLPINNSHLEEIEELTSQRQFNPNLPIGCGYKSSIIPLTHKGRQLVKGDITTILLNDDKKSFPSSRVINHRPIELLCQIANTLQEQKLVEKIMQLDINPTFRNEQNCDLVVYSLLNENSKILEIVLNNTPKILLPQIMEGKGRGTLAIGNKFKKFDQESPLLTEIKLKKKIKDITLRDKRTQNFDVDPLMLAIDLHKEYHAILLFRNDEEYSERSISEIAQKEGDQTTIVVKYDLIFRALEKKCFKVARELLKYETYQNSLLDNDKDSPVILANIIRKYDLQDAKILLECLTEVELDLTRIKLNSPIKENLTILDFFCMTGADNMCSLLEVFSLAEVEKYQEILKKILGENFQPFIKAKSSEEDMLWVDIDNQLQEILANNDVTQESLRLIEIEDYQLIKNKILKSEEVKLIDPKLLNIWDNISNIAEVQKNIRRLCNIARNYYPGNPNRGLEELGKIKLDRVIDMFHPRILQLLRNKQLSFPDINYIENKQELQKLHNVVFNENYQLLDYVIGNNLYKTLEKFIEDNNGDKGPSTVRDLKLIHTILTANNQELQKYVEANIKLNMHDSELVLNVISQQKEYDNDLKELTTIIDGTAKSREGDGIFKLIARNRCLAKIEKHIEEGNNINDQDGKKLITQKFLESYSTQVGDILINYAQKNKEDTGKKLTDQMLQIIDRNSSSSTIDNSLKIILEQLDIERVHQIGKHFPLGEGSQLYEIFMHKSSEEIIQMIKGNFKEKTNNNLKPDISIILENTPKILWDKMASVGKMLENVRDEKQELKFPDLVNKCIISIGNSKNENCKQIIKEIEELESKLSKNAVHRMGQELNKSVKYLGETSDINIQPTTISNVKERATSRHLGKE